MTDYPEPIDPRAALDARPHAAPRTAVAAEALSAVDAPADLARLAAMACARIQHTAGREQMDVLTNLVHAARAVADAAERTTGHTDDEVSAAAWRLSGAIGSRLTAEPLPVLRGEGLPGAGGV